ncbi:hypothetical protein [Aequorivita sp. Q41]|uniref:hypothetical protein n=1 Tax=Aequorivita sp. Q41 TaxID=3153300 RepID=UPI00324229D5
MDHNESEGIRDLLITISQFKASNQKRLTKADDANTLWNASLFFCKVVWESNLTTRFFNRVGFEKFTIQYNKQNSTKISTDTLFSEFWLREVLGIVHIPDAVRVVTNDYEKYKNHQNELFFLRNLYQNNPNQTCEESSFEEKIQEYENSKGVKISRKWIADTHWIKPSKDKKILKIGNVDYLFNLMENWDVFAFLYAFKIETYERQRKDYGITSKKLITILNAHRTYFPLTPSLAEFEENKTFIKNNDGYLVRTTQNEIDYWHDLKDEISGHYWEALVKDVSFSSDEERVLHFIDVMLKGAHWPNEQDYISSSSKQILLATAIRLIKREKDIESIENEFAKCYLDQRLGSHYGFQSNQELPDDSFEKTGNVLELYRQFQNISSKNQSNIFYDQGSRNELAFLVRLVVLLDKEYNTIDDSGTSKRVHYHNIKQLLRLGLEKPYLVWEVVCFVQQNRPEVIPHLLIEADLASLGFYLLNHIKTEISNRNIKQILRKEILEQGLNLLLNSYLRKNEKDKAKTAQLIFQLIQEITKEKRDSVSQIRLLEERRLILEERENSEQQLLSIIENCEVNGGFVGGSSNQSLLFQILEKLVYEIDQYQVESKYFNGAISLPYVKLDALSWLCKFLTYTDYKLSENLLPERKSKISSSFISLYIEKIEQVKVMKRSFNSLDLIEALPSWPNQNEELARIDWLSLALVTYESGSLSEFLNPRFKLTSTKDDYHKKNNFQANKIRTHLFVLLTILKAIQSQKSYLKKEFTIDVKKEVEITIVNILKKYGQEKSAHSINILDQHFDRQHFRTIESELLPFIIKMGDVFEDKSALFDQLLKTGNVVQLLYVFSHSETEGIKVTAISRIKEIDITKFTDEQCWLPEITYVTTELSKIPELQAEAKKALKNWQQQTSKRKVERETSKDIFEAQLMQAYYANDESKIMSIEEPESGFAIHNEFKPSDHKRFFIGLIRYKDKLEDAYQIFDSLIKSYPNYATFALNRFGAKVNLALKNESKEQFKDALKEWLSYEKTCPLAILQTVEEKVNYNKLTVLLNLDDSDAFNMLYEKLTTVRKFSPDMVELRVQMLVKNEFINEARTLVENALSFHSALNIDAFKFLKDLESKISKSNSLEEIKKEIRDLNTTAKNSMSSIKPLKYEDDFGKQMANEIVIASKRFLANPKSYNPNADEDDYSSIIKEILESKLSTFSYHIKDQPKGGKSANGKKAGERDLVICDDSGELSVIEAFKHSTKTVVQKHLTKIFDYTHMRNVFFVLAYDLKPSDTFKNRWKYYTSKTLKVLKYPSGYEIDKKSIWDATNHFNVSNSAIKICRSTHKSGTDIYHIMLNVNYFINS